MIVERTQEGKAEARKKDGYREGRPRLSSVEKERMDHAMELLQTESYAQVTKMTGFSKRTLVREKARRKGLDVETILQNKTPSFYGERNANLHIVTYVFRL